MDFFRDIQHRIVLLDQQQVISLSWIQRWLVMLVITFGSLNYAWFWLVAESDPNQHFPPSLLPPELRKKLPAHGTFSEREARVFALREIEFAVVACIRDHEDPDEAALEAVTMMKSAALLSRSVIHFHIFTEDKLLYTFMGELDKWPSFIRHRVSFKFRHFSTPESVVGVKNPDKPCSTFKLFIPNVLRDLDYVMYVDPDAVFLSPPEVLWNNMLEYNESQMISLSSAKGDQGQVLDGNLNGKCTHAPPFGGHGLNSEILLFDIFKLRHSVFKIPIKRKENCYECDLWDAYELEEVTWHPTMLRRLHDLFSDQITRPDRDIFSIIFYFNPDKLHLLPCSWNFHWRHCEAILRQTSSRFLRLALPNAPLLDTKDSVCNTSSIVHANIEKENYYEFEKLRESWTAASYETPRKDLLLSLVKMQKDIVADINLRSSSRSTCMAINTRLFVKSLETCFEQPTP